MEENILKSHKLGFPKPYSKKTNSNLSLFLEALAKTDADHADSVQKARLERFLFTSNGNWLDAKGSNLNRPRPRSFNMSDVSFRELIRLLSFRPMQVYGIFEDIADFFLGPDSISRQLAKIYSVDHNLIKVAIKKNALIVAARRGLVGASYLHGDHLLENLSEFYSGYIFPNAIISTISPPAHGIGSTTIDISQDEEKFPATGEVICVGDFNNPNFECKYYTGRALDILTLETPLEFSHDAGEIVYIPQYITKTECTLQEEIVAGQSYGQILTSNSADFPDGVGVVWFEWADRANGNDERVVYKARINNGTITLDNTYTFKKSFAIGSNITLCAKKPTHAIDGTDYAFYLNGTESLVNYITEVLEEVKAEGVRLQLIFN